MAFQKYHFNFSSSQRGNPIVFLIYLTMALLPHLTSAQRMGDLVSCSYHADCYSTSPPLTVYKAQIAGSARFGAHGCMCIDGQCKIGVAINSVQLAPECIHCGTASQCSSNAVYQVLESQSGQNVRGTGDLSNENQIIDGYLPTDRYVPHVRSTRPPTNTYRPYIRSTKPPTIPDRYLPFTRKTVPPPTAAPRTDPPVQPTTNRPDTTEDPVATDGPSPTEEPETTAGPVVTEGPVVTTEGFGSSTEPALTDPPVVTDDIGVTDQPEVTDGFGEGSTTEGFGFGTEDFA